MKKITSAIGLLFLALVLPAKASDPVVGGAFVNILQINSQPAATGAGSATAGTQRVVLANDSPLPANTRAATSTITTSSVTCGTTSTMVFAANAGRHMIECFTPITNAADVFAQFDVAATTNSVIIVAAHANWDPSFVSTGTLSCASLSGAEAIRCLQY